MPPALPDKDDRRATWAFLEAVLEGFMRNPREGLDDATHTSIHQAIHNFCTISWIDPPNTAGIEPQWYCPDLYTQLKNFLAKHLVEISGKSESYDGEALLNFYIEEWKRYVTAAKQINLWFVYLNVYWVDQAVEDGEHDVHDIFTLQFTIWRDVLLTRVGVNVTAVLLQMVEKHRKGDNIRHLLITSLVDSFLALGLKVANDTNPYQDVYHNYFEKPLLEVTTKYYENELAQSGSNLTADDYMTKLESWVENEKRRAWLCVYPVNMNLLAKACVGVPTDKYLDLLQDKFQVMLDNDQQDSLARMYRLFSQTSEVLVPLRTKFEAHVKKSGQAAMVKIAFEGEKLDPKAYVHALFRILVHFEMLVNNQLAKDSEFTQSLHNASKGFVEPNTFCNMVSNQSSELLAKHVDSLLRIGKGSEKAGLDKSLAEIMTVFKYFDDKTDFQKFYTRMLAKRLINASSSEEAELIMIKQLAKVCGSEYTAKFQLMLLDVPISRGLNNDYKDWRGSTSIDNGTTKTVDSNYHTLCAPSWPLNPPTTEFLPPSEIANHSTSFESFYLKKHCGRKLTWMWNLCKGEMQANYIKDAKTPYTFMVSTYQMAILLLFNETDVITYEEAQEATKLSSDWLDPSLNIFVKAKVLVPNPKVAKPEPGTSYTLNYGFKSKRNKVNLNIVLKSEQTQESAEVQKSLTGNQQYQLQSAIVRIMKSNRQMKNVDLVQKTIAELKSGFIPKVSDIEKAIEDLIEREYLQLLEGEELGYVA